MKTALLLTTLMAVIPSKTDSGFMVSSDREDLGDKKEITLKYPKSNSGWRYYIEPSTSAAPLGFKTSFDLNKGDFAGPDQGYLDVDAHGWPCKRIEKPEFGVTYRVYRLLNNIDFAFELTVIKETIE